MSRLWTVLKEKFSDQVDLDITPDEFIDFEVANTHGRLSNQEILADINDDHAEVSDKGDDESVEGEPVRNQELKKQEQLFKLLRTLPFFQNLEKQ